METRATLLSASTLCSPPPLNSANPPKTICYAPAKQSLSLASRTAISAFGASSPTRKPRKRRSSRPNGLSGAQMSMVELDTSLAVKTKAAEISNTLKGTSIFLVGMNCTMKTKLGELLADGLRYYYFNVDSLVEQAVADESAAESFQEKDEKGFRDSETEVLKQLSSMGRLVVCAGDGAVQSSTNLGYLRYGISVWIDVPLDLLANEITRSKVQSDINEVAPYSQSFSEILQELAKRYDEMKGGYGTADATVSLQKVANRLGFEDLNSVTTEDMAVEALKEIEKLTRVKKMMEAAARPF